MKRIVAVNGSPRLNWNTDALVTEAARGAASRGTEIERFDLYRLEKFTGCISCFGCKRAPNEGRCVCRDGLFPVLEAIRDADGLILGSPNYLGDVTAGVRALYERLVFQSLTYKTEPRSYNPRSIPVLLIMTSNAPEDIYARLGYDQMLAGYQNGLGGMVGPTKLLVAGNTLQVKDYSKYDWTMFDPKAKRAHHKTAFPKMREEAFWLGVEMADAPWFDG